MNASEQRVNALIRQPCQATLQELVAGSISEARLAQASWARCPWKQRRPLFRRLEGLIAERGGQLAEASVYARSRPVTESLTAEVLPLAEACRFLEREGGRVLAPRKYGRRGRPGWLYGVRGEIHREPYGVVLIIGPSNYPLFLPGAQALQALAAGNAVVLKPGARGAGAARAFSELLIQAGFHPRLFTVLPESIEAAHVALAAGPDKVLLTGSSATGQEVSALLAPGLISATMELSGCDAVIIREDADLMLAAKAIAFGLRLNRGATCMAPKRVFVARSVVAEFESRLTRYLASKPPDHDTAAEALLRRTVSPEALCLIEQALGHGAHIIAGGLDVDGSNLATLVLGGVSPDSALLKNECFGAVVSLVSVAGDEEAVLGANHCPFGLAASIFTRDEAAGRLLASRLQVGSVTINDLIIPTADARLPFGGRKRSGTGVTRGREGLLELTRPKVVTITRARFRPAYDPPRPSDEGLFTNYLTLRHGRGLSPRCRAAFRLLKDLSRTFQRRKAFQ